MSYKYAYGQQGLFTDSQWVKFKKDWRKMERKTIAYKLYKVRQAFRVFVNKIIKP